MTNDEKMKKLVLIDGNAIVHRAYHALPNTMTTRNGEPTNAVYGFTTTLIKVLEDLKPDFVATSFDLAGPTFRHEQYKEYKATRVKADQALYDQIPRIKEILETMEIPIYEKEGFEADDVIGTIVNKMSKSECQMSNEYQNPRLRRARLPDGQGSGGQTNDKCQNVEIYIVSGDKDIFQLIDGNVKVYSLRRGLSQMEIIDHDNIKKEYNLDPSDFIDLKSLAGDPSDNIPGVPGVGEKTAIQLLQEFDSLGKLYAAIGKSEIRMSKSETNKIKSKIQTIKPRILELLKKYKEQAFLSQKLATIHRDVPIDFDLEKCRWGEYDREKLRQLFEELGFRSLLRRFDVGSEKSKAQNPNVKSNPKSEIQNKDKQLKLL